MPEGTLLDPRVEQVGRVLGWVRSAQCTQFVDHFDFVGLDPHDSVVRDSILAAAVKYVGIQYDLYALERDPRLSLERVLDILSRAQRLIEVTCHYNDPIVVGRHKREHFVGGLALVLYLLRNSDVRTLLMSGHGWRAGFPP